MDLRLRKLAGQEGTGLLLAMFVTVLLTAVGVVLLSVIDTEVRTNKVDQRSKKSFYLSEAGFNHGREALRAQHASSGSSLLTPELNTAAGKPTDPNRKIDFNPATVQPVYDDQGNFVELDGTGDDNPLIGKTAVGDGWYYAFLMNDDGDGADSPVDSDGLVKIAGVGVGPNRTFEVVEGLIDAKPMLSANIPATILMLGPSPNFDGGESAQKSFDGDDCGVWNKMGDPSFPVVGVTSDDALDEVQDKIPDGRKGLDYEWHDDIDKPAENGDETAVNVDAEAGTWKDCLYLKKLAAYVRNSADVVGKADTSSDLFGTKDNPKIVYIEGDYTLNPGGNVEHGGVLWVTGTLTFKGSPSWYGPIFVVGEGAFNNDGAGNSLITGASVIANITGDDGDYGTSDDCAGPDNQPGTEDDSTITGEASYTISGKGNSTTQYCSKYINQALARFPMRPLAFRQW